MTPQNRERNRCTAELERIFYQLKATGRPDLIRKIVARIDAAARREQAQRRKWLREIAETRKSELIRGWPAGLLD